LPFSDHLVPLLTSHGVTLNAGFTCGYP
jgi:hypothetical protein